MMQVTLVKSAIEREEGINHLLIRLAANPGIRSARLQISLSAGLQQLPNLNGYNEHETGCITLYEFAQPLAIVVELFHTEPLHSDQAIINVVCSSILWNGSPEQTRQTLYLPVVDEPEYDSIAADEQVVAIVKAIASSNRNAPILTNTEEQLRRMTWFHPLRLSEWEKKYRIEGFTV